MEGHRFWNVKALPHVADADRESPLAEAVRNEIDKLATTGLALRLVSVAGVLFAGVVGESFGGSGPLLGGVLETVPGERQAFERETLRTWSNSGRTLSRYNSRPRSPDAPPGPGLNPDLFDELARGPFPLVALDFVPVVRRTDLAKRRLGIDSSGVALRWALSVAVMAPTTPEKGELDRLLFLPESANSLTGPVRHGDGDDAFVELATWQPANQRPGACMSSGDILQALLLAHPSERVGPAAVSVPLMGMGLARDGGEEPLKELRGSVVSRHVLVTGDPGTGKSTAVQEWLGGLVSSEDSPTVLVVDPVKGRSEYGLLAQRGFSIFDARSWVPLNPLVGPPDVDDNDFASFLVTALDEATGLSQTFPLGASVLRNAVRTAISTARPDSATVATVVRMLSERLATLPAGGGRADDAAAVAFSVRERVVDISDALGEGSLCGDGLSGVPWDFLLSNNCVVLLGGLRDESQRQLVGMLMAAGLTRHQLGAEHPPRRVLVLEESHTFFPRGPESRGVVEEIMSRAVAEQRSKELGLVFVDQRPTSLPNAVVANCGSVIAFRNSDANEATRVTAKLNLGPDGDRILTALPDFVALVRYAGDSSAHRVGFTAPDAPLPAVECADADLFPRRTVLPWCEQCPYPCQGSFVLDGDRGADLAMTSGSGLPPIEDAETAFLEGAVMVAAESASSTGRVAAYHPLDGSELTSRQVAATYCGAAYAIAADDDIPVQLRLGLIDRLGKWTRRGSFR